MFMTERVEVKELEMWLRIITGDGADTFAIVPYFGVKNGRNGYNV
jgi:hypothetical protein